MADQKVVQHAIGNLGGDPEKFTYGSEDKEAARFSLAVTRSYPSEVGADDGKTRWLSVAVFKESIVAQIMDKENGLHKGSVVGVEGVITQGDYQGKPQYNMKASRVAKVEWFVPSADERKAQQTRASKPEPSGTPDSELDW